MVKNKEVWDASECALILIDYQAEMFQNVRSIDRELLELNVRMLTKAARAFNIPIVLSTVGVKMGVNRPTVSSLIKEIHDAVEIDRTSMNAWEDEEFVKAVKATDKKRLVFCALYTEICLTYPVIEALAEGYEVTIVTDAVGGMSDLEHETAIQRMIQKGAVPNTTAAMICEWFRDWQSPLAEAGRHILRAYLPEKKGRFGDQLSLHH